MGRRRSEHVEHVCWRLKKKSDEEYGSYRFRAFGRLADGLGWRQKGARLCNLFIDDKLEFIEFMKNRGIFVPSTSSARAEWYAYGIGAFSNASSKSRCCRKNACCDSVRLMGDERPTWICCKVNARILRVELKYYCAKVDSIFIFGRWSNKKFNNKKYFQRPKTRGSPKDYHHWWVQFYRTPHRRPIVISLLLISYRTPPSDTIAWEIPVSWIEFKFLLPISSTEFPKVHDLGNRIEFIVHMAAETHVDNSIKDPVPFMRNNVWSTISILEYTRGLLRNVCDLKSFFYFSTDEVFDPALGTTIYDEWDRHKPTNPYSAS